MINIQQLPGAQGIKELYKKAFKNTNEADIICLSRNYKDILGENYFDTNIFPMYKNLARRELILDTPNGQKYRNETENNEIQIKLLKTNPSIETDLILKNGIVYFISYDLSQPYGLIIEDPNCYNQMLLLFNNLWATN